MIKKNVNIGYSIPGIFFLALIMIIGLRSHPYETIGNILATFTVSEEAEKPNIKSVNEHYTDAMWLKSSFINLNGVMARALNIKGYYSDIGIYVTDRQYIVSRYSKTATDYEYEQLMSLKEYLDEIGVNLLYVNAPAKYLDDGLMSKEFGVKSYGNQNTDIFLERVKEANINYIDLRDRLTEDEMDIYDMFYRTDHHWTTESGLWATRNIAEALNQKCGYHIDLSIYDESDYIFKKYKECWLGEQGKKLAVSYIGLDDFTCIKPKFDTSLVLTTEKETREGGFDILVDENYYNPDVDLYAAPSWHYSYMPMRINQTTVHNNKIEQGKILLLADSYSQVVVPFLSLGVSDVSTLVLRQFGGDLKEYIAAGGYDTVVIAYAQFMIGAHDNPKSANYKMFSFN